MGTDLASELAIAENFSKRIRGLLQLGAPPYSMQPIAEALGYRVRWASWNELRTFGASEGDVILVARTHPQRNEWTIAHELAHLELGLPCGQDPAEERLVDRCAGALLIPSDVALPALAAGFDLGILVAACGTSLEGTAQRVLDLLPSAVAVREKGGKQRSRVSLLPGAPPPEVLAGLEALAAQALRGGPTQAAAAGWTCRAWTTQARSRAVAMAIQPETQAFPAT
jgi:hypothetical protein